MNARPITKNTKTGVRVRYTSNLTPRLKGRTGIVKGRYRGMLIIVFNEGYSNGESYAAFPDNLERVK